MKRITFAAATVVALFILSVGAPKASADKLVPSTQSAASSATSQMVSLTMMSIPVPDGGTTVMLLGGAMAAIEALRRKLRA